MKNNTIGVYSTPKPQAWVAVSNNRQKIYGSKEDLVYLDNGQEFQIELYNPTSTSYLAKIYLNDKIISSSGLVLRPGQRYFLDRFIEEKKKFLFSTYDVDDTEEAKEAIKNNGKVKVEFYPEHTSYSWSPLSTGTAYVPYHQTWTNDPGTVNPIIFGGTTTNNVYYASNTSALSGTIGYSSKRLSGLVNCSVAGSLETGRVEKGEKSDQDFGKDSGSYSWYCGYTSEYQILPRSAKPVEVTEIRDYCTGCGTRSKKKTWKFCPNCGESLDQ
jgi:hypothetical protein